MPEEKSIADKLHQAYITINKVEEIICDAFEKYEPEVYQNLDFTIGSDEYDNSIEIYIKTVLPYPYEPSWHIRDEIYKLGFSKVYWNFIDEPNGKFTEEIRGEEPRKFKNAPEFSDAEFCKKAFEKNKIGWTVDRRFNYDEWYPKYSKESYIKSLK